MTYSLEIIALAYEEAKDQFSISESRSRELVQKAQVLISITGVLLTLWGNTTLRVIIDHRTPLLSKLVSLVPLAPLTAAFALAISSIRLVRHAVTSKEFLVDPGTWALTPERFRVRMLKGLIHTINENEESLRHQQRRYRIGLSCGIWAVGAVVFATVWLVISG